MSSCRYEIVTDRDKKILELIEKLRVVDVFTVDTILFSNTKTNRMCQKRLTNLSEFNRVKRWRPNQISQYIYHQGRRPGNIEHALLVSHFVAHLYLLGADVTHIKREWLMSEGIRVDLLIGYKLNNKKYVAIVEAENTKSFDKKYQKLEEIYLNGAYKEKFKDMPRVICVTDKNFKLGALEVITIKADFSNMSVLSD